MASPAQTRRLFVALEIDPLVRSELYKLEEKLIFYKGGFSRVPDRNMHMTLLFIGEVSPEKAGDLAKKFSEIEFSPFEFRIRGLGMFPNQNFVRVVWAGCESGEEGKFEALYGEVCGKLGTTQEEKFVPHITLARVKSRDASLAAVEFVRSHERVDIGTTLAKRVVLMESVLGEGGAKYSEFSAVELH